MREDAFASDLPRMQALLDLEKAITPEERVSDLTAALQHDFIPFAAQCRTIADVQRAYLAGRFKGSGVTVAAQKLLGGDQTWAPPVGQAGLPAKSEQQEEESPFLLDLRTQWLLAVRADRTELGLWVAVADVRDAVGRNVAWELVRSTTMKALAPLLRSGELTAVDLAAGGDVVRWSGGPEDWIARIETEWAALRRDPNIGDIAWFWDFRNDAG